MNPRVHPTYKTKYRVTHWAKYDQALGKRGDTTLWITPKAIKGWKAKPTGHRGAPRKYSDLAIETALTLRLLFQLPLRQAEGFLRSLLELMDLSLDAPDHTALSRRSSTLDVDLGAVRTKKPMHSKQAFLNRVDVLSVRRTMWNTGERDSNHPMDVP